MRGVIGNCQIDETAVDLSSPRAPDNKATRGSFVVIGEGLFWVPELP